MYRGQEQNPTRTRPAARAVDRAVGAVVVVNILLVLLAIAVGEQPQSAFKESGFMTKLHVVVLLLAAVFAGLTFQARRASGHPAGVRRSVLTAPELFWLIVAAAFVFLAIDELARVHEGFDKRFHELILHQKPTHITTRIDDVLIGLYGVGALAVCWRYRAEVLRVPATARILGVALVLLFIDVVIDLLDHDDVLKLFAHSYRSLQRLGGWATVVEESVKVLAGSLFCLAFYVAWRTTAEEPELPPPPPVEPPGVAT